MRGFIRILGSMMAGILCLSSCGSPAENQTNSVTVIVQQDLGTLDPYEAQAAGTQEILFNLFEGLVKIDAEGDFKPAIAESYDIAEDYRTYSFVIRENVTFHNGEKMTMEDVVFSLHRAIETAKSNSPLKNIKEIKETGNTVALSLDQPDSDLLIFLNAAIVPKNYQEQSTRPVGTGPFRFVEYLPQERIVIERNDQYYIEEKKAKLDKVIFKIVTNAEAAFMELQAGTVDIFPNLTSDKADRVTDGYEILEGNQNLIQLMAFNHKAEPFNQPKVRQAINFAMNKQEIIQLTSFGYGSVLGTSLSPKSIPEYYNKETEDLYQQDIEKAKQLLKEAGYEDGLSFTITVPSNYQFHVDTAQVIADQLKKIGVTAKINKIEWGMWLEQVYNGRNYEATIIGLTPTLSPRDSVSRYHSQASDNFMNYSNPNFDQQFDSVIRETDSGKKVQDYHALQLMLAQDAAAVYIQDPALLVAVNKRIKGYQLYKVYIQDMSTVSIEK